MKHHTARAVKALAIGAAAAVIVTGCAATAGETGGDEAAPVEFKLSSYVGESANEMLAMQWFADELEERSDGRYTIKMFFSESLLKATDTLPGVAQGRADIGFTNPSGYHPAEVSLTSINELPLHWNNVAAHAGALQHLYGNNDAFRKQYDAQKVHVLYFAPNGESIVGSNGAIESVGDLKGKKLRAIGRTADALTAAGVNVVAMPSSEIYQSVDQGLLDGFTTFPFATIETMSLQEVVDHVTDIGTGNYGLGAFVMNAKKWDSLPAEAQKLFSELSAEAAEKTVELLVASQDHACDTMLGEGLTMNAWPQSEIEKLVKATGAKALGKQWAADQESMGLPGTQVLSEYTQAYNELAEANDYVPAAKRCMDR